MSQQPPNPQPKLESAPDDLNKLKELNVKMAEAASAITAAADRRLKEAVRRLKLHEFAYSIIRLKRDIETLAKLAEAGGRKPDVDSHLRQLTSLEAELDAYLKENGVTRSQFDELVDGLLNPNRWWQFWRGRSKFL